MLGKLQKMSVVIPRIDMDLQRIPVYIHTSDVSYTALQMSTDDLTQSLFDSLLVIS